MQRALVALGGLVVAAQGSVSLAETDQRVKLTGVVADLAGDLQNLAVVVGGLVVAAAQPAGVTEAGEGVKLAAAVADCLGDRSASAKWSAAGSWRPGVRSTSPRPVRA